MRDDLVAVEIEVDPVVGAAAFGAAEDGGVGALPFLGEALQDLLADDREAGPAAHEALVPGDEPRERLFGGELIHRP